MSAPVTAEEYAALPWEWVPYTVFGGPQQRVLLYCVGLPDMIVMGRTPEEAREDAPRVLLETLRAMLAAGMKIRTPRPRPTPPVVRGEPLRLITKTCANDSDILG